MASLEGSMATSTAPATRSLAHPLGAALSGLDYGHVGRGFPAIMLPKMPFRHFSADPPIQR